MEETIKEINGILRRASVYLPEEKVQALQDDLLQSVWKKMYTDTSSNWESIKEQVEGRGV